VPVQIEQLDFSYSRLPVLKTIHAHARPGRITAILDPNASGKSTLLKCVIGSLKPQRGCALIDGMPAHTLTARQLAARTAYVPQRSTVSAAFTVRQVVELGRYSLAPDANAVERALGRLDLGDIADRPYPALSVGQQQRVTLGRALAQLGPHGNLVLDEPTSAMDLRHVASCMSLLREIADGGATVLLAMHDLSLAASIADDVWLLDGGRLVASGSASDVLTIENLQRTFGVRFEWIDLPDGPRLLAGTAAFRPNT